MAIEGAENEIYIPPYSQLGLSFQGQKLSGLLLNCGHTWEKDGQGEHCLYSLDGNLQRLLNNV